MPPEPEVIAHRGAADAFPENTLAALRGAIDGGVRLLEFDIQLSADRIPLLVHDGTLERTGGTDIVVTAWCADELTKIPVPERARLGDRFAAETVPTLDDALDLLAATPGVCGFVELKRESLRAFGRRRVLDAVLPRLEASRADTALISFDYEVLAAARKRGWTTVGWVLERYDDDARAQAEALRPDYLFCNHTRLPRDGALWAGDWRWAVYEVTDAAHARRLAARGADLVESMAAVGLRRELQTDGH